MSTGDRKVPPFRILGTSDWHLDAVTSGVQRFNELHDLVFTAMGAALKEKVDLFVFNGDLCDPDSGPVVFRAAELTLFVARQLQHHGIPSIWITGNHDVAEVPGEPCHTLLPLSGISGIVEGQLPHIEVMDEPCRRLFMARGLEVIGLPFTSTGNSYDPAAYVKREATGGGPLLVLSHLNLRGMVPGEETLEMPRGRDVFLPDEELQLVAQRRPTLVLQGHYHKRQRYTCPSGLEVQVIGSIARFTHGADQAETPGFIIVEI